MIVPTVISLLKESGSVTGIINDRIFPVVLPQSEERKACIIVWIGGNDPTNTNFGNPMDEVNFMIHVDGRTYAELDQLCMNIRTVLEAYTGDVIKKIRYVTENDNDYDYENRMFSRAMVFNVRKLRNGS